MCRPSERRCVVNMPAPSASSTATASSTTAPAPSPNSTQVVRSVQSRMREKVSAPITSARRKLPAFEEIIGRRHGEDEAGAHRLQIERRAMGDAEPGLHRHRGRREGVVRRRGGEHDEVDVARLQPGILQRRAGGVEREVGGHLAIGGDAALLDAGALDDPFVGGVHHQREVGIGEDALGQIEPTPRTTDRNCVTIEPVERPWGERPRAERWECRPRWDGCRGLSRCARAVRSAPCRSRYRRRRRNPRRRCRHGS